MANPSLQIGNSNWAIKESNLLGYSTAGTRFVPQPITMTRASAGTRVNSSGLVETVELLGSELVVNGNFENNVIGWNKFKSNATESWDAGGYLDFTKTGVSGRLGSDVLLETNKTYKISVNVISLGGILDLYVGLSDFESPFAGVISTPLVVGTNTFYLTYAGLASSKGVYLQSAGSNYFGLTASIDSISVKEVTKNNLARVDYDGTASSLLVEPQRTNTVTYSNVFSNVSATLTPNYGISPDGTQNSARVQASGSNSGVRINTINSSNNAFAYSVYVKGVSGETVNVRVETSPYSLLIQYNFTLNGEWQRIENVLTASTTHTQKNFYVTKLGGSTATDFQLYGSQVEEGSYPTSYIPTSGSTVTRVQETYSKTGISNLINSTEGVLFAEIVALTDNDATSRSICLSDGTSGNRILFRYEGNNLIRGFVISGGTINANFAFTYNNINNLKFAIKWKVNDFAYWVNGTKVLADASGSVPTGLNRLALDNGSGTQDFFGKVKQLQVFKTALTDSELIALTTQ